MRVRVLVWFEEDMYVAKEVVTGVTSQGETLEEALSNLQEALELYLEEVPEALERIEAVNEKIVGVLEIEQKLPRLSGYDAVDILVKNFGFRVSRQRGSHAVLIKLDEGVKRVTVAPLHRELMPGTLPGVMDLAGKGRKELLEAYERDSRIHSLNAPFQIVGSRRC